MLNTKITAFPGHIQSVYYQNILKIVTHLLINSDNDETANKELLSMSDEKMNVFLSSGDVEAQERVRDFRNKIHNQSYRFFLGQCYFKYPEIHIKINGKK